MRIKPRTIVLCCSLALSAPTIAQVRKDIPVTKPKPLEARVDEYINSYVRGGNFSGSILIAKGARILLSKGYGIANYENSIPNTPKTKFHIASLSKSFTAAAILLIEEQGRIKVSDPISKFVPDYPAGDKITIDHLLTHSSGIQDINRLPSYGSQSRFPQTPQTLIAMFKDKPLNFKPGEKYSYSNSNYILLAYILEKISGKPYGDFMRENIFNPLGLSDTAHDGTAAEMIKDRASGYIPAVDMKGIGNAPYLDWSSKTGNGSLYSTVEDLFKWDRALHAERLLKKAELDRMFTKHIGAAGYGWFVGSRFNRDVVYMNGNSPGFNSYIAHYLKDDVCIIVLGNNDIPLATQIGTAAAAILFGESYESPKSFRPINLSSEALTRIVGAYRFDYGLDIKIFQKNGQLFSRGIYPEYDVPLVPISENELFNRFFWDSLVFVKDESGKPNQLHWKADPNNKAKRVD